MDKLKLSQIAQAIKQRAGVYSRQTTAEADKWYGAVYDVLKENGIDKMDYRVVSILRYAKMSKSELLREARLTKV